MADIAMTVALAKALGGGGGGGGGVVSDVLLNGQSVVNAQGEAEIPKSNSATLGVVRVGAGLAISSAGELYIPNKPDSDYKAGEGVYSAVTIGKQHMSAFYALAKAAGADMKNIQNPTVGVYPEAQKSAISQMLSAPETVSGSTPSITAKQGVQYICGEVSTIDITVPESGIIDVIFESGSTPAVLTVTPPTGVTMKWPDWFDPTALEADKVYEVNIANGRLATVMVW